MAEKMALSKHFWKSSLVSEDSQYCKLIQALELMICWTWARVIWAVLRSFRALIKHARICSWLSS